MKKLLSVLLASTMVVSLAACGSTSTSESSASAEGSQETAAAVDGAKTFVLGEIGPLTGSAASYGISVKQGCEVAIEEINSAGGVKVGDDTYVFELNSQDDQADAEKAVNAYNTLRGNIDALIGCTTSGSCLAVVDSTYEDGLFQITPSGSALDITKNPNVFRICFTDPLQGETIAQYVVDEGYESVAVLYNKDDEYSTGIEEAFKAKLEEIGKSDLMVAEESFGASDVDFNTQLTKIKAAAPKLIFVPGYYEAAALITTQAKSMGITAEFVGSDGWDGVLAQVTDPSVVEGAVFLSPFLATDPSVKSFVDAYQAAYGSTPDQFAADAYDAVYTVKAAMEKAGAVDSESLIAAMTQIEVKGVTGDMTFNESGEPNKGAKYVQIVDGEYTAFELD